MSVNKVILIGRLGKDPETRYMTNGEAVCNATLATSENWKDKGGETKESTEWVNIEAWGRLGEVCQEYLKKGSLIYIEGRLKTDKYEDKGETKYFTKIVAQSLEFLDKKPAEEPMQAVEEDPGDYEA